MNQSKKLEVLQKAWQKHKANVFGLLQRIRVKKEREERHKTFSAENAKLSPKDAELGFFGVKDLTVFFQQADFPSSRISVEVWPPTMLLAKNTAKLLTATAFPYPESYKTGLRVAQFAT